MKKLGAVKQSGSASKPMPLKTTFTDAIVKKGGGSASPTPTQPSCCSSK